MKKLLVILFLVFVIGAALWLRGQPSGPSPEPEAAQAPSEAPESAGAVTPKPEPPAGEAPVPAPDALGMPQTAWSDLPNQDPPPVDDAPRFTGALESPSVESLREEVARNPHGTPPSLLLYAQRMADRMEAAMQTGDEADRLFAELEDCVRSPTERVTIQVQVVCYTNAGRLSRKYGGRFKERFENLVASAPTVASMVKAMGLDEIVE
ncbi:MAG: hypothetical protein IT285_15475 [Bdellovibrionales bacterium]|nr:hypothetical protein [Bdellovibrionales bacterium]